MESNHFKKTPVVLLLCLGSSFLVLESWFGKKVMEQHYSNVIGSA